MGHEVLLNKCLASLPLPSLLIKGNKDDGEVRGEVLVCHHHPGHLQESRQPASQVPRGRWTKVPGGANNKNSVLGRTPSGAG